jgi:hypothetical protein
MVVIDSVVIFVLFVTQQNGMSHLRVRILINDCTRDRKYKIKPIFWYCCEGELTNCRSHVKLFSALFLCL